MQSSIFSAKKWLSSTAIRIFSSSTDEADIRNDDGQSNKEILSPKSIKRGRGRPRKDPNEPKRSLFIPERRDVRRRRASSMRSGEIGCEECGPNDGETRFLLTYKALPNNLQIIAKTLYPHARNKYEEHRLSCKILNDESRAEVHEIFIPTFRKLTRKRNFKDIGNQTDEKEFIDDKDCLQRHRPLELAEKRERRREEELARYELYIRQLSREYPELLNRKYSIKSDESLSSIDH